MFAEAIVVPPASIDTRSEHARRSSAPIPAAGTIIPSVSVGAPVAIAVAAPRAGSILSGAGRHEPGVKSLFADFVEHLQAVGRCPSPVPGQLGPAAGAIGEQILLSRASI